jgi:hypothetical protein
MSQKPLASLIGPQDSVRVMESLSAAQPAATS